MNGAASNSDKDKKKRTVSRRVVAEKMVKRDRLDGLCSGSEDDVDHALDYFSDSSETMGDIDQELIRIEDELDQELAEIESKEGQRSAA